MVEGSAKDLLVELYEFNQENRLDFYAFVRVILEQSQCAIISKPYWPVVDGYPGSEVFTYFPDLECSACDGYKCRDIGQLTVHAIQCLTRKGVRNSQAQEDLHFYKKYGIVPKEVKKLVEEARNARDQNAVCIAPVFDHPNIKGLADLQRKERERKIAELVSDSYEEASGPNGPIIKLAKGAEMPLDRMVWIQTPLYSELATLLLAGMQPIRHTSKGIHLPVLQMRETGVKEVIHLHVERFEELANQRMTQKNWETLKHDLEQIGHINTEDVEPFAPSSDLWTGDSKNSFNRITGRHLNFKRPYDLITERKLEQKMTEEIEKERRRVENVKANQEGAMDLRHMAENKSARITSTSKPNDKKVNGEYSSLREPLDERPGCSKYI